MVAWWWFGGFPLWGATFFYAPCLGREHIFKFERTKATNLGQLAANLVQLGAKAGQLGATWGQSGRTWGQLRLIWDKLGTNLVPTLAWHPASESGVDAFSTFSIELELISGVANPKGGNRALSIRIRGRCIFVFSHHLMKNIFFRKAMCPHTN